MIFNCYYSYINITFNSCFNPIIISYAVKINFCFYTTIISTIIIMYIAGSVFILIEIIHLIIVISIYKDLSTSNTIALNFISLIPALLEIVLYSRVSVIVNDVNYVQYPLDEFNQKDSFFNYYGSISEKVKGYNNDLFEVYIIMLTTATFISNGS